MATNVFSPLGLKSPISFNQAPTSTTPAMLPQKPPTNLSANGVKAIAPGNTNQGMVNTITPTFTAPTSSQTTVSNQGTLPSNNVQPAAQQTQQYPTYGGIIGSLVNSAQGNPAAQNYTQQAAQFGAGSIPIANQANDIAQQYGKRYSDLGIQGANFQAGQLTTGTSPIAEGNAAVTAQTTAAQQNALAQGEQAALQGIGFQLTGQQQAANAANAAAGQSYTGQGLNQSALTSAAGYAQPQLGSIGQVPFNPLDQSQGQILGSQGGGLQQAGNLLGQFAGAQAVGAAPYQGQASVIGAPYGAQAHNITQAGTSTTDAANAAYQNYYQQSLGTNTALNQVESLGNLALQTAQGGNINPFQIAAGNMTLAEFKRQLSSPSQATFDQSMATFQGALSQLLAGSSNVTPTQVSTWSSQIANGTMPVSTLQAIYNQGLKEGNLKLQNLNSAGSAAYQQLQGGQNGGSSNVGSSWDF